MPIINIKSFPPSDSTAITRMITDVQSVGAKALKCAPSNVWVMFQPLLPDHYVQSEKYPPVVVIRAQAGRTPTEKSQFVAAVANAVSQGLSVAAEDVWIHYQEMRPEDVWFEGHWAG